MHRAVPVIAATAGGLAFLANFHTTSGAPTAVVGLGRTSTSSAPTPTTRTSGGAGPAGPTTTTSASGRRTIDGPVVPNPYGDVQVRVTLDGTKIVDVQPLQLPVDRRKSQQISNASAPRLRTEVLQAQSANIDLVSGASFTSDGYARSVQGALDKAGR
jgi:uncharacterized protein with FMN-binding domain